MLSIYKYYFLRMSYTKLGIFYVLCQVCSHTDVNIKCLCLRFGCFPLKKINKEYISKHKLTPNRRFEKSAFTLFILLKHHLKIVLLPFQYMYLVYHHPYSWQVLLDFTLDRCTVVIDVENGKTVTEEKLHIS